MKNNDRFKFRVWNKPGNSYISAKDDADFLYLEEEGNITVGLYNGDLEDMMYLKEEDLIIEQCTGLKDKNGRLIYEGDIIEIIGNGGKKLHFRIAVSDRNGGYYFPDAPISCSFDFLDRHLYEIIGNIHENPELLKECK